MLPAAYYRHRPFRRRVADLSLHRSCMHCKRHRQSRSTACRCTSCNYFISGTCDWVRCFGNLTEENPAELTAMHLDNSCSHDHGICFVGRVEPVTRAGATDVANELMHISSGTAPYDAILHLGLESVAKGFRLEIVAANILAVNTSGVWSADVPCNKSLANGSYADIVEGGPCLLATTLPLDRVSLVHLHPNAAREYWSRDAGTYFCNEMYYRTLSVVRSRDLRPARGSSHLLPVVFVHLPTLALSNVTTNADMVKRLAAAIVIP